MAYRGRHLSSLVIGATLLGASAYAQPIVRDFVFRQYDGGPAWGVGQTAQSGDLLVFSFAIAGLKTQETENEEKKIRYEWTAKAVDPRGVPLAEPISGRQQAEILAEDKDWIPKATGTIKLPDFLPGGNFQILLTVKDAVGNVETKAAFPFPVTGPALSEGTDFSIGEVEFLRSEQSTEAISPAAYRPGDTVWIRFRLSGFSRNSAKEVDVRYGFEVVNAVGKVVFTQPVAVAEKKPYFYPPSYLPALLSFTPNSKVPRGEYSAVLLAEDAVAGKQIRSENKFRLE